MNTCFEGVASDVRLMNTCFEGVASDVGNNISILDDKLKPE